MAATAAQRAAPALYAIGLFLVLKHEESFRLWATEVGRTTVHFLTRPPNDGNGAAAATAAMAPVLQGLNAKIDALIAQVGSATSKQRFSLSDLLPGQAWVGTACGVACLVYVSGYSIGDFMYVTRRNFKTTTDAMRRGIHSLADALAKVRSELLERIRGVEVKLDESTAELKALVQLESEQTKAEVRLVGEQVESMSERLDSVGGSVDEIRKSMIKANRGIWLLCHVFAESFAPKSVNDASARARALHRELLSFTQDQDKTMDSLAVRLMSQPDGERGAGTSAPLTSCAAPDVRGDTFALELRGELAGRGV